MEEAGFTRVSITGGLIGSESYKTIFLLRRIFHVHTLPGVDFYICANFVRRLISPKTIYNYIDAELFPNLTNKHLPVKWNGKKRKYNE